MHTARIRARTGGWILAGVLLASCGTGNGQAERTLVGAATSTTPTLDASDDVFTSSGDVSVVSAPAVTAESTTTSNATSSTTTTAPPTSATSSSTTVIATTTPVATTAAPSAPTVAPATSPSAPTAAGGASPCPPTGSRIWEVRPASNIPAPPIPEGWRTESAGRSVEGRDLTVFVRPVAAPARIVMVIGGIHGNEPVSPPTVRAMVDADIPVDTELWLLPLLNPDGAAVGNRCNANGVDLNRNFSWGWRAANGGPGVLSEPESTAAAALVERVDPDLVIWVHQPLGYVSSIGATPDSYEQAWAAASRVPVRRDVSQQGGGESWTAFVAGIPSMLIEVDTYDARPDMVAAHVAGFDALLAVVVPR